MASGEGPVDPQRMTVDQAAKVMSAAFNRRIEAENIYLDIDAGAPTNDDGSLNLVQYTAWLAKEMGRGD